MLIKGYNYFIGHSEYCLKTSIDSEIVFSYAWALIYFNN